LAFYGIKISDLGPHSVQQIAFFTALCEGYLGCPAYFLLWLAIFHGRATRVSEEDGGELLASRGITFQVQGGEDFLSVALPGKAASAWRKKWFYMREATPEGEPALPQYSPEPSLPRRLWVKQLPKEQAAVVKLMQARTRELKANGLKPMNMYNSWLARHLPPLRARAHLMCEYKGDNDLTRTTYAEWDVEEYKKALGKITRVSFTAFDEPMQPFDTVDNPTPDISPLVPFLSSCYCVVYGKLCVYP
jgi:hypothetical protein